MLERISRKEEFDLFTAWIAISISFAIIKIAPYGITGPVRSIDPVAVQKIFGQLIAMSEERQRECSGDGNLP